MVAPGVIKRSAILMTRLNELFVFPSEVDSTQWRRPACRPPRHFYYNQGVFPSLIL